MYECVSQGREWFYSLHLATDNRFALRDMQPSAHHRDKQYPDWWIRGAGVPYPTGIRDFLSNDITGMSLNHAQSVLIVREQQHHANISGGRETLVPERLLYGVVPHALLDSFRFWEDESLAPRGTKPADFARLSRGYKRLLGYPIEEEGEQMMIVEFQFTGSWTDFIPPAINTNQPYITTAIRKLNSMSSGGEFSPASYSYLNRTTSLDTAAPYIPVEGIDMSFIDLFREIKQEILKLLRDDKFPRWKNTHEFQSFISSIKPYDREREPTRTLHSSVEQNSSDKDRSINSQSTRSKIGSV